jgi:hypothetical protein
MTQDEIIEMAGQAGFVEYELDDGTINAFDKRYEAFAKLVAAKAIADLESQERNFCPRCGKRTNDIHTCTPPQRTWVGLTDEEVVQCQQGNIYHFYRCIEAKLKEKNT